MSEISRLLGQEERFDATDEAGKPTTYKLAPMGFEAIGLWEAWLKQRAWRNLELARRWLSADMYKEQSAQLQADLAAGKYDFYSQVSVDAQQSWEGSQELIFIRVAICHPEVEPAFLRKMIRDLKEKDLEKYAEIIGKLNDMDIDPNLRRPARADGSGDDSSSNPSVPSSPESPGTCDPGKSAA